ncbi:NDP-sugar synthase [Desulfococcaceae bacterium HSG9]|nr:NDP-sugar synthase [Desulfococcaceae bacterium HSG9]
MRAILITTNELVEPTPWGDAYPSAMMPLIDRPFIQHVVEYLVNQGFNRFDVVLCQYPEKIKALLGDGSRWGVKFQYHVVKEPSKSVHVLRCLDFDKNDEWLLLVSADRLCQADFKPLKPALLSCHRILYCAIHQRNEHKDKKLCWSGWAQLSKQCCLAAPGKCDEDGLFEYLLSFQYTKPEFVIISDIIRSHSYAGIMAAHKAVLSKQFNGLILAAREVEEGVWLSRNISLHPTVQIQRPIYIGQNCRISKGVRLGPHTVIGDNCVIDDKTILRNTIILPGSYVGISLELQDVVVDQYRLINIRLESAVTITENFIMGSLPEKQFPRWLKSIPSRLLAAILLILTSPFFLAIVLILKMLKRPLFNRKKAVRLPAPHDPELWCIFSLLRFHPFKPASDGADQSNALPDISWQTLLFYFFPALINIMRGHLRFVGVAPRTADEIKILPPDWRILYLQSKIGLISEALVYFGANPSEDELRVAETFYSVSASWKYDLKLLAKYFGQLVYLWPKPNMKT